MRWEEPPVVARQATLPNDRVLAGRIRNQSSRAVELDTEDVKLVDAEGREVFATARFSSGFGRDIYPPRYGRELPEADRFRLGEATRIAPGQSRPVTIAWRVQNAARAPVRVELPGGRLAIPPR